ncbi:DNA-3-methyladenine glycosylase [Aestuariimicrobium soli]|uniref:DNA-3-methyladenine glycosylase n=1 Tax=Aestuariimicrobium soli TaxID=2035834 RepID=UPI003EBD3EAE
MTDPAPIDARLVDARLADPVTAARHVLGGVLSTFRDGRLVAVRITEVEAYRGSDDPAAHTYRGETARNRTMFGPAGHLYVYRHLGLHHCVNLVCGPAGVGHGLLLRAGQVVAGDDVAWDRRLATGVCRSPRDLARGPARLTVALAIVHADDGVAWHPGPADDAHPFGWQWPARPADDRAIASGPRIGVPAAGADLPWRFWLRDDECVSGTSAQNQTR